VEVNEGERALGEQPQDEPVDERPDWLHEVGRERVAVVLVGVQDAEPRVEADEERRESRLTPRAAPTGS